MYNFVSPNGRTTHPPDTNSAFRAVAGTADLFCIQFLLPYRCVMRQFPGRVISWLVSSWFILTVLLKAGHALRFSRTIYTVVVTSHQYVGNWHLKRWRLANTGKIKDCRVSSLFPQAAGEITFWLATPQKVADISQNVPSLGDTYAVSLNVASMTLTPTNLYSIPLLEMFRGLL